LSEAAERRRQRAERIGLNEAVFRQVNERLEELTARLGETGGRLDLVCECGRADCAERIQLGAAEYEALRSDPVLFAVVPGHEQPEAETVVSHGEGFDVVRKKPGAPEQVARETDPRR
jgi:hypothetical protein